MKQVLIKFNDDTYEYLADDEELIDDCIHELFKDILTSVNEKSNVNFSIEFSDPNETINELRQKIKSLEDEIKSLKNPGRTWIDWEPTIRPLTTPPPLEPDRYPFHPIVTYGATTSSTME